jgi:hypothetical protein
MTDYSRQGPLGRRLREMYQRTVNEELPDEIVELLCRAGLRMELERLEGERVKRLAAEAEADPLAPTFRNSRRRQDAIGRGLQQLYGKVLKEDVPQEFIELLCRYAVKRKADGKDLDDPAGDPAGDGEPPAKPN